MRYAVRLSYLGTEYHGWQKQPNAITVQQEIENALSIVTRQNIEIVGSGRTDAGVHSYDQLMHFDSEYALPEELFKKANRILPKDIALIQFSEVAEDFHARFLADSRSYIYTLSPTKNPFKINQTYFFHYKLDLDLLNEASKFLVGKHDFKSFSKVKTDVNTYFCTITEAYWKLEQGNMCFHVSANRFLRGMVRALVGTLLEVGLGKQKPSWIKEVIESQDRSKAGRNVPPDGLVLSEVSYPVEFNWRKIN